MVEKNNKKKPRADRWYLELMAPNTRGSDFAWLDPTPVYLNQAAFNQLLDDLIKDITDFDIQLIAGIDAMGFVLGTGLAARLNLGFLPVRKAGKLCVETDAVEFTNYSGRRQVLELRKPALEKGTRVLVVDQWVETGGTMEASIKLIERQGGIVAGFCAIAIEENEKTKKLCVAYPNATAVVQGSSWYKQCNDQKLKSFENYYPEIAFEKNIVSRKDNI